MADTTQSAPQTHASQANAIRFGAWALILFGAWVCLSVLAPVTPLLGWAIDLVFWPVDGAQVADAQTPRLLFAIAGGIVCGWGVLVLGLAGAVHDAAPEAVRRLVIRGYVTWFVVDSVFSVLAGAPLNVIGNAAFLALLLIPLMRARG